MTHKNTVAGEGAKMSGTAPSATKITVLPVITTIYFSLPRYGNRRQNRVEDRLGRNTLKFGLGAQLNPVTQRRMRERLNIIGRHKSAALKPRPRPTRCEQRSSTAR